MKYYLILIILILNISAPAYGESEGTSKKSKSILRWLQLPDYGGGNKKTLSIVKRNPRCKEEPKHVKRSPN